MAFVQRFRGKHPEYEHEREWERYGNRPLLSGGISLAVKTVGETPEVQALPKVNRNIILGMTKRIMEEANRIMESGDDWRENFWGLYLIGSRAVGAARPDSDVDLLSVGTFYADLAFGYKYGEEGRLLRGFRTKQPDELPGQYNVGEVDRKYLIRATPINPAADVLPIDLNVVDLTFMQDNLDYFREQLDVDQAGTPLARLPLIEVTTPRGC